MADDLVASGFVTSMAEPGGDTTGVSILKLAQETDEIYAKMALIEMATEFRVIAERLERKATRRTADRIRQRIDTVPRGGRCG
jgi:hypothetical protein